MCLDQSLFAPCFIVVFVSAASTLNGLSSQVRSSRIIQILGINISSYKQMKNVLIFIFCFLLIFMRECNKPFREYVIFNDRSLVYSWDLCFDNRKLFFSRLWLEFFPLNPGSRIQDTNMLLIQRIQILCNVLYHDQTCVLTCNIVKTLVIGWKSIFLHFSKFWSRFGYWEKPSNSCSWSE